MLRFFSCFGPFFLLSWSVGTGLRLHTGAVSHVAQGDWKRSSGSMGKDSGYNSSLLHRLHDGERKSIAETLAWISAMAMFAGVIVLIFGRETKGKYVD